MKRLLVLPVVGVLLALFSSSATADYTDSVTHQPIVTQLSATHHVVVDPAADPALPNPDAINAQIIQTGLSMYVVNVAKNQTVSGSRESTGAVATLPVKDALYDSHNPVTSKIKNSDNQMVDPPLIILVIDAKGYHARSFNVNQSIADATGPNLVQAAGSHKKDLNGTVSAFISAMAGTPATGPVISNVPPPPPPPQPTNWAFAWALLWISVAAAFIAGCWASLRALLNVRARRREERDDVENRINHARKDVERLAQEVLKGKDVSTEQNSATMSVSLAERAFKQKDMANARSHVSIAEDEITAAYKRLNPAAERPQRAHITAMRDVPKKTRKAARISVRSPQGGHETLRNYDYKTRQAPGYRNYYPGGVYNDVYFPAGWYPYLFWGDNWTWTSDDVVHTGSALPTHTASDYGYHDSWSGSHSGGGSADFDHSSSGHHDGGGSTSFTPEPVRHHSSSSDSGSSSSGGSAGIGGSSSGGGSADF